MIFNLQKETTDRATPTDRRSRDEAGWRQRGGKILDQLS